MDVAIQDFLQLFNNTHIVKFAQSEWARLSSLDLWSIPPDELANTVAAFPSKEASLIIHALAVAILVRIAVAKYSPNWLLHLVFYLFVTRASDTARAILLGKPITWLADDHAIMHYLPIWWLVNFFPFDLFYKIVSFPLIKIPLIAVDQMVRVMSIKASIDAAITVFPDSICAPIIVGTIAGQTAPLMTDLFKWSMGEYNTKTQLSKPGWPIRSAFYASVVYVVLCHPTGVLLQLQLDKVHPNLVIAGLKLIFFLVTLLHAAAGTDAPLPFDLLDWTVTTILRLGSPNYVSKPKKESNAANQSNSNQSSNNKDKKKTK